MGRRIHIVLIVCVFLLLVTGCTKEQEGVPLSGAAEISGAVSVQEDRNVEAGKNGTVKIKDTEQKELFVFVCGSVKKPGVYSLSEGSRVFEAVKKAGGFTKKAAIDSVNLAEQVTDGQMIRVNSKRDQKQADGVQTNGTDPADSFSENAKVNLNTADVSQLQTLSGIGESKAQSIIAYREENGNFSKPEDIMNVSGIKEGTYNKIKDQITV